MYTYNGTLLTHKKDDTLPFGTTWMDLECIMPSEISQMGKSKYCFTYMWNLKNKTNEQTKHKTHGYREQTGYQWEGRWGVGRMGKGNQEV